MFTGVKDPFEDILASLTGPADPQVAALCWRPSRKGELEFLLVTTRRTGRWTPPKGNLIADNTPAESAAIEAWEEAGVRGDLGAVPLGAYETVKLREVEGWTKLEVETYPLMVRKIEANYPEKGQREAQWFAAKDAIRAVREPRLREMIAGFRPDA